MSKVEVKVWVKGLSDDR